MQEYRTRINVNGRVLLPLALRQQLHLKPGEELILRLDDDEVRLYTLKHSLKKAQALVRKHAKNQSLIKKLKDMRHKDAT